jgi:hypothetical protein
VIEKVNGLPVVLFGTFPLNFPVPFPSSVNVNQPGRPDADMLGVGTPPTAETGVVHPDVFFFTEQEVGVIPVGADADEMVRVRDCVALFPTPLLAVTVITYVPASVGVPLNKPDELKVIPAGRAPLSLNIGCGVPVATTWKLNGVFIAPCADPVGGIDGAESMMSVNGFCVALGEMPLEAVNEIGYVPSEPAAGVPVSS